MFGLGCGVSLQGKAGGGGAPAPPSMTLVVDTFFAAGTWTSPASFQHPDGTADAAQVELWSGGGGGTTATGGGGGGEYARKKVTGLSPSTGYAIAGIAGGAAGVSAVNTTFNTAAVIAVGGASGTTGTGGTGGTGDVLRAGGNGTPGAGTQDGGGGAGSATAAVGPIPGDPEGGWQNNSTTRQLSAGGRSLAGSASAGARGEGRVTTLQPAVAGFPRRGPDSCGRDIANATTRDMTLPATAHDGSRGKLLIVVQSDAVGGATISMPDWTQIGATTINAGNNCCMAVFQFDSTSADPTGSQRDIVTNNSESVSWRCFRVLGAGNIEVAFSSGSSTNPDPPAMANTGSKKRLIINAAGVDSAAIVTSAPTNYGNILTVQAFNTSSEVLLTSERMLESSSEDPGAWGVDSHPWVAVTIGIDPA